MFQQSSIAPNRQHLRAILRDQRGLSTVEYVIILVLIAAGAISSWRMLGGTLLNKISDSNIAVRDMEGASSGNGSGQAQAQSSAAANSGTPSAAASGAATNSRQAKGKVID